MSKKINEGKETLIPKEEWVPAEELQENEGLLAMHPIMNQAFEKILEVFKPHHKIALLSLCTSTRPYSKSYKWKTFKKKYEDVADLIICSGGGVIPIEYDDCWPYMTYDVPATGRWRELYIKVLYDRLIKFFEKNRYDVIVFNFRPTLRNRKAAEMFMENYKYKDETKMFILPTEQTYEDTLNAWRKAEGRGGLYYPDCEPLVIEELDKVIYEKEN